MLFFLSFIIGLPECIVESCVNCGVNSSTDVCTYCSQLTKCRYCNRHLPQACFTTCNRTRCRGCARRSTKPHVRRSVGDVISEIDILTTREDVTFESFVARNADQIRQHVNEYRQQFKYRFFNLAIDTFLDYRLLLSMSRDSTR